MPYFIPAQVHYLELLIGEINRALHAAVWLHLVFSKWPRGPDAIRHSEASVSGLASPPLAQQQKTRWEVRMTSERSRQVVGPLHRGVVEAALLGYIKNKTFVVCE